MKKIKEHAESYARATTLHGFAYMGEMERHWSEKYENILFSFFKPQIESQIPKNNVFVFCRILWIITIAAGFAFSVIVITPLYDRFTNNPIIRSIESNNYPIENISFPAVTICSNNKVIIINSFHYD